MTASALALALGAKPNIAGAQAAKDAWEMSEATTIVSEESGVGKLTFTY